MEGNTEYPNNQQPPEETANPQYQNALDSYEKIKQLEKEAAEIKKDSFIDSLTGCYNRNAWEDCLKRFDTNRGDEVTLVMADVNGLKTTNDTFGHSLGDTLIKNTASFLQEVFSRKGDRVFRIGGDEFVVACEYVSPEERNKFNSYVGSQLNKDNLALKSLDFAVGISHSNSKEDMSIKDTLKRADEAMYQDKQERKSQKSSSVS